LREKRIASYQICDFNLSIAADALLSRGMMGDGVIDFATIGTWVRNAGYTGDLEVEIFNQDIWDTDGDAVLATMKDRYQELILPYA
jgi:sugar phosphate isomerase/epimerase